MSGKITKAEARRLKKRWLRFIRAHRSLIRKGHRFRIGDPRLSPQLIPHGFHFTRGSGPAWPPASARSSSPRP